MSRTVEFCAALLVLLLLSGTTHARSSDRNQPMDINANSSDCSSLGANANCVLTGNVTIDQGSLHVKSAKAVLQQANGKPSRSLLSGGVSLQQEMDDGDHLDATAANLDYDMKNETMVFTGNVVIRQSRGSINGERVVYNLKTGQLQSGGDGGGRVKMRILPKDTEAPPAQGNAKGMP
ncbi:MAG: lipopolysaccharide transport periplasmic protein LptA [Xanthomonadaceae bacterium]|nr:lipopolysaccharide transport periplasmic protein LptA [Xanthomonadaceae bacterium]